MIDTLFALLSLTAMEIVLGIDNIVFISILVGKLPLEQQAIGRKVGISLALATRLALLFSISWLMALTRPLFTISDHSTSGRDLVLLLGGLFLIAKATYEIHEKLEASPPTLNNPIGKSGKVFSSIVIQIALIDIVFSLDSVITAVGMAKQIWVMVTAMIVAVGVMLVVAGAISDFVHRHPTIKILALSFLLLIGVMLTAEGMGQHIPKGYVYFAMAFSLLVEFINMRYRTAQTPVELHEVTGKDQN